MNDNCITVQEAIDRGFKVINRPSKIILISAIVMFILLLIFHFSWWDFLLLPIVTLLPVIYSILATPGWKIWAYEHVADIHQLQRSAEIAGLLDFQSFEKIESFISGRKKQRLKALQGRFSDEHFFINDSSIPATTPVYSTDSSTCNEIAFTLTDMGIQVHSGAFYIWDDITNERVARVSYKSKNYATGTESSSGSRNFFRFESGQEYYDISLSDLAISAWKLDLLLYIYRGRFNTAGGLNLLIEPV